MKLGKNLNSTFSNIYVKNLPRAVKRLEMFEHHAKIIDLRYQVFKGIEGSNYVSDDYQIKHRPELYPPPANKYLVGNCYSGIAILLDAMANNYESFVTCDDDAIFYDLELEYIKPHLPEQWDIIILGSIEKVSSQNATSPAFEKIPMDELGLIAGCQAIAIHNNFYNTFLMEMLRFDTHGLIGDALIHLFAEKNSVNLYQMLPHVTYQERNILPPYTVI